MLLPIFAIIHSHTVASVVAASDGSAVQILGSLVAIVGGVTGLLGWYNSSKTRQQAASKDYVSTSLEALNALSASQTVTIDRLKVENAELRANEEQQAEEIANMQVQLAKCQQICSDAMARIRILEVEKP